MSNQQDVVKELNQQVANWTVAYTKLHNFHWYVKGPNFFSLHVKFEELYNEASQYVDELAERILAVGGNPVGTLTECLEQSIVKEAAKGYSAEQMVEELSQDFTNISKQLEKQLKLLEMPVMMYQKICLLECKRQLINITGCLNHT